MANEPVSKNDQGDQQEANFVQQLADAQAASNSTRGVGTDLVTNTAFKWSLNSSPQARALAPRIYINFLLMNNSQIEQLLGQVEEALTAPYNGLYDLTFLERMTMPFFSNYHHNITNTWKELSLGQVAENVAGALGGGAQAAFGAFQMGMGIGRMVTPASKIEAPRVWEDINLENLTFGFTLYNTDLPTYRLHKAFVDKMVYYATPEKVQATFVIPPVLCEYEVPGIRRGLIASFDFSVSTKGQSVFDGVNIPDAYDCSFSLTDLLMQTKDINTLNGPVKLGDVISRSGSTNVYER